MYEFDGSNALKARHTHGPGTDDPLYTQTGAAQYFYYHKDGMGSVREITNGAGEVARRNDYDSFGNIVSVNGCPTAPEYPAAPGAACDGAGAGAGDAYFAPAHEFYFTYAYTGRQWDAEASLYHYRARYYDPHIGRFISEDPQWSPNLYAYVSNNPMNYTDPSGEIIQLAFWVGFVLVPLMAMYHASAGFLKVAVHLTLTGKGWNFEAIKGLFTLHESGWLGKMLVYNMLKGTYDLNVFNWCVKSPNSIGEYDIISVGAIQIISKNKYIIHVNSLWFDRDAFPTTALAALFGHELLHVQLGAGLINSMLFGTNKSLGMVQGDKLLADHLSLSRDRYMGIVNFIHSASIEAPSGKCLYPWRL
ncbi:MAG: tRNA(Glu)-specific nuclease WapA precursor [bacterium ADurb.Bin236]|nr:MAG: tRNA(Glu)-specific nuclease WapA precursor [bacterium ADurb.Bin236]HPN95175.1 RHS repeat-associated core domain-containing protein [bacterium]